MARTTRSGSVGRESLPLGKRTVWFKYQKHHKEKRKITKLYCLYIPVPSVHHIMICRCWFLQTLLTSSNHSESCPLCFHNMFPCLYAKLSQLCMLHDACALTALTVEDLGTPERQEAQLCTPQHPERLHIQLSGFAEVISGALVILFSVSTFF